MIARSDSALYSLGGMRKYLFAQESFYLQGIFNDINEQDAYFLDCKHKHMMKRGAPPDKVVWLPIDFQGFTSRINSKGYHSLVPGLISIFLETVWVPLKANKSHCIKLNLITLHNF